MPDPLTQHPSRPNADSAARGPIIVGGCHRSGTSLVRRILNTHSEIHCGPEVKLFVDLTGATPPGEAPHLHFISSARALVSAEDLWDVLLRSLCELHERAAARASKARWADKNPENVIYLSWWERVLGTDWTFVHVVRDPLDTLASMQEADMPYAIPATLSARITRYNRWTTAGLDFAEAHPDRSHRVVYEQLVGSPTEEIRALMHAVGTRFEQRQLEFNKAPHDEGLEDPKVTSTNRIHADSVGRWRDLLSPRDVSAVRLHTSEVWRRIDPDLRWMQD